MWTFPCKRLSRPPLSTSTLRISMRARPPSGADFVTAASSWLTWKCKDGYVSISTNNRETWDNLRAWMAEEGMVGDLMDEKYDDLFILRGRTFSPHRGAYPGMGAQSYPPGNYRVGPGEASPLGACRHGPGTARQPAALGARFLCPGRTSRARLHVHLSGRAVRAVPLSLEASQRSAEHRPAQR